MLRAARTAAPGPDESSESEWADEFGTALRGRGKGPAPGFFRSVFDEV